MIRWPFVAVLLLADVPESLTQNQRAALDSMALNACKATLVNVEFFCGDGPFSRCREAALEAAKACSSLGEGPSYTNLFMQANEMQRRAIGAMTPEQRLRLWYDLHDRDSGGRTVSIKIDPDVTRVCFDQGTGLGDCAPYIQRSRTDANWTAHWFSPSQCYVQ